MRDDSAASKPSSDPHPSAPKPNEWMEIRRSPLRFPISLSLRVFLCSAWIAMKQCQCEQQKTSKNKLFPFTNSAQTPNAEKHTHQNCFHPKRKFLRKRARIKVFSVLNQQTLELLLSRMILFCYAARSRSDWRQRNPSLGVLLRAQFERTYQKSFQPRTWIKYQMSRRKEEEILLFSVNVWSILWGVVGLGRFDEIGLVAWLVGIVT